MNVVHMLGGNTKASFIIGTHSVLIMSRMTICSALFWEIFILLSFTGSASSAAGILNAEGELIRKLTDPSVYEKAVRPVRNTSDPVVVAIKLTLNYYQLDSSTETLTFFAYAYNDWTDEYMRWNKSEYDGLQSLLVPVERIWLPDMGIFNRIDSNIPFKYEPTDKATLYSYGRVDWFPGGMFTVKCRMKLTKFPFDEQECSIYIGSYTYERRKLQLVKGNKSMTAEQNKENGEWSSVETDEVESLVFGAGLPTWHQYRFTLSLRRKSTNYVLNMLIPCVAISVLDLVVFCLPCESGEKISLGITTLVALTVFQMTIAASIPRTTNETPILLIYLASLTGMSAVSIVLTVLVLKLFYTPADREMSPMVHSIVRGLAKITGNTQAISEGSPASLSVSPLHKPRNVENDSVMITNGPLQNVKEVECITSDQTRVEWTVAARIIDKFLMYVFVILMFVLTAVCFVMISRPIDSK